MSDIQTTEQNPIDLVIHFTRNGKDHIARAKTYWRDGNEYYFDKLIGKELPFRRGSTTTIKRYDDVSASWEPIEIPNETDAEYLARGVVVEYWTQPFTPTVGSVVQLKSGGPAMTVKFHYNDRRRASVENGCCYKCVWITKGGEYREALFPIETLKPFES